MDQISSSSGLKGDGHQAEGVCLHSQEMRSDWMTG